MGFFDNLNSNCSKGDKVIIEVGGGGGGGTVYWSDIEGKPLQFPPTAHTHTISEVDGLNLILSNINNYLEDTVTEAELTPLLEDKADKVHTHPISQINGLQVVLDSKLDESSKGSANGLAELDGSGKVPSSQLPSYVDDVEEYDTDADFPIIGESGKIYITRDTNLAYRWGGTNYVEISPSLALGETPATAYRGDRGKIAYDHTLIDGNPHNTTIEDIPNLPEAIDGKVDKVAGKGLSTNDYSNADKDKLDSIGLEWFGTRSEYDALGTYNPTTKYFIEKEA